MATALTYLKDVIDNGPFALIGEYVDNFRLAAENSVESLLAIQFTADDALSFNGNDGGTLNHPNGGPTGHVVDFTCQPRIW